MPTWTRKNRWTYAELVEVLDKRSQQMIMSDASNDGRKTLQIIRSRYASTEKPSGNCLVVDCGATCHTVNNVDVFMSYDKSFDPKCHFIELADG